MFALYHIRVVHTCQPSHKRTLIFKLQFFIKQKCKPLSLLSSPLTPHQPYRIAPVGQTRTLPRKPSSVTWRATTHSSRISSRASFDRPLSAHPVTHARAPLTPMSASPCPSHSERIGRSTSPSSTGALTEKAKCLVWMYQSTLSSEIWETDLPKYVAYTGM